MNEASHGMSLRRHQCSGRGGLVAMTIALSIASIAWTLPMAGPAATPIGLLVVGGLVSGWFAGVLGIGGALITLPVLYVALPGLGVPAPDVSAAAVATALVAMVPTTIVAAWRQHQRRAIDIVWLRHLAAPMTVGAAAGALAAAYVNGPVLGLLFAAQSATYGTRLLFGRVVAKASGDASSRPTRGSLWLAPSAMAGFCACVGMGGGSLVPGYLMRRGVEFRHAVATGSALNLCIALGGSGAFLFVSGNAATQCSAYWPAGLVLGISAVVAAPFGVNFSHGLRTSVMTRAVAAVNIVSAVFIAAAIAHG